MGAGLHLGLPSVGSLMGPGPASGGGAYSGGTPPASAHLKMNVKGAEPARLGVTSWGQGLFYAPGEAVLGGSTRRCPQKRPYLLG